jgi:hypothetical protein
MENFRYHSKSPNRNSKEILPDYKSKPLLLDNLFSGLNLTFRHPKRLFETSFIIKLAP